MCHWAKFCIENTHHTLVAGKQVRYIFRCQRVYREQIARYVDHLAQSAITRHMYAVIITWREIQSRKITITEFFRELGITTEQLLG
ncbi:Uncharacterised protein [Vibrio cholerae]|nr:Uncharacterised protein [Vibrio cholerae]